jgi:DNA polymerase-4
VFVQPLILHADLDAFYASVEQRDVPRLRGRPVIVGGGVVLSCSYEARACGVRTAMGGRLARRLCPEAEIVSPRMEAYSAASKAVFEVFHDTSPLVEGLSIDEAFLDVRGLEHIAGTPLAIAGTLRRRVHDEVGLPITVGVASTKFLAKVASGIAKPDGLLLVPGGAEPGFLHPLPVERLWGVGPVTSRKLRGRGLATVGDVACLDAYELIALLGPASGRQLHALAHNRDPRRVRTGRRRRSMGAQRALGRGPRSPEFLDTVLVGLVERLGRRLRKAKRVCRTVSLRLRFEDFSRASRSVTLAYPTQDNAPILAALRGLLASTMPLIRRQGITLVGIAMTNLEDARAGVQLALKLPPPPPPGLDLVLDEIRDRYGAEAITRAVLLGRDPGLTVPLLPD